MGELFKEYPFTVAGSLVAAGLAAWFGWSWWAILLALLVGLFIGAMIDGSGKSGKN